MKPEYIILHHSLTADNKEVSWGAIRKYHKSWAYLGRIISEFEAQRYFDEGKKHLIKRPWKDIGYHFGIELVGSYYEILMGRKLHIPGAHCNQKNMNQRSWGICFVGNYDIKEVPLEMWKKGLDLVKWLLAISGLEKGKVKGHREFAKYKTCPGMKFDLDKFRDEL